MQTLFGILLFGGLVFLFIFWPLGVLSILIACVVAPFTESERELRARRHARDVMTPEQLKESAIAGLLSYKRIFSLTYASETEIEKAFTGCRTRAQILAVEEALASTAIEERNALQAGVR
jgi:hypothetical protein